MVWNGWQLGAFKQFLISQLRDLMEGLTSPTVLEKQLGHQKYFKQLGLKNMVMPVAAAGADRQVSHLKHGFVAVVSLGHVMWLGNSYHQGC